MIRKTLRTFVINRIRKQTTLVGNCFFWANVMNFCFDGEIFTKTIPDDSVWYKFGFFRFFRKPSVEHYMFRLNNGAVAHFDSVLKPLPPPFNDIIFFGKIRTSRQFVKNLERT